MLTVVPTQNFIHIHQLDMNFQKMNNQNEHPTHKQNAEIEFLISGDFAFQVVFKMYVMGRYDTL